MIKMPVFPNLQVKSQLQDRLQELQPLPEMLKNTEIRLHESEDQLRLSERKNSENAQVISQLSVKVFTQDLWTFLAFGI